MSQQYGNKLKKTTYKRLNPLAIRKTDYLFVFVHLLLA